MSLATRLREEIAHRALHATLGPAKAGLVEVLSTIDTAQLLLAYDEIGWQRLGGPQADNGNDFTAVDRVQMVKRSRLYYYRDPLAKRAITLYTAYALGQGLDTHHKNAGAQTLLADIYAEDLNRDILGPVGLRRTSDKLLVDGELFFALFTKNTSRMQVRLLDPLEIAELVTNPDDAADVWYFRRETAGPAGQRQDRYYPSARADWGGLTETAALARLAPERAAKIRAGRQANVAVVHVRINTLGSRGYPFLAAVLDWAKSIRQFAEDHTAIMHAASQIATKKTVKGGRGNLQAMADALRAGTAAPAQAGTGYNRQGPIAASTLMQNEGTDTEWFKTDTGASNAERDMRMLKLMYVAGTGLSEHFYGDSQAGTLATATAMERPVELTLADYQLAFKDGLEMLDRAALRAAKRPIDGLEVTTPPILNVDVPAMLTALTGLVVAVPEFNDVFLWKKILATISIKDIDAAIKAMQANQAKREAQAAQIAQGQGAAPDPTTPAAGEPSQNDSEIPAAKGTPAPTRKPAKGDSAA